MAYQPVDIGSAPNDGTGDPIRDAFDKCNDNFVELYAGLAGLLDFKGSTDCSANPNYPAASKGDYYLVSVAGKIGGASGIVVTAGDTYFAIADNAGGTQAGVGTSWTVVEGNLGYAPVNKAGDTMTGDLIVPDEAYDATAWDDSLEVPTKNAVRDKIEALVVGGGSVVIGIEIDGGGSTITTGFKGYSARIPQAHTITKVTALSVDTTGPATSCSITVDVWADTYTNFPPTVGDKISASAPATLSTATKSEDSTLTGWTTSIPANSVYGFSVASVTGAKKVLILIEATV